MQYVLQFYCITVLQENVIAKAIDYSYTQPETPLG